MTRILAFDTATAACSAALWEDGRILARRMAAMDRGQAEALLPMIEDVMAAGGLGYGDLDLLATSIGPGAFTGLRIGLAAARGLALAGALPLLGVTTTEALAHGTAADERNGKSVLALVGGKRADIFLQAFTADLDPLGPLLARLPDHIPEILSPGAMLLVGDEAGRTAEALERAGIDHEVSAAPPVPDAAVIAGIAATRWRPGIHPPAPEPLYLRAPAVTRPGVRASE